MVAEGYKIQSFAYACADFAVSDVAAGARLRRGRVSAAEGRYRRVGSWHPLVVGLLYHKQVVAAGEARGGGRAGDSRKPKPSSL